MMAKSGIDDIERLVNVNLLGTVYPMKALLPGMVERGRGRIVVVASVAGRFGSPFEAAYAATKFAQIGLVEAVSVEVAGRAMATTGRSRSRLPPTAWPAP
jgi:NAD(P)-dependent dehydrogenase (short-subunit alcohol dehydrogenase family)